jgi:hypothetical protein
MKDYGLLIDENSVCCYICAQVESKQWIKCSQLSPNAKKLQLRK